jgi:NitT/TauT family transport system permease protein
MMTNLAAPAAVVAAAVRQDRLSRARQRASVWGSRLGVLLAVLLFWQLGSGKLLDPYFFSKPSAIWEALVTLGASGKLVDNALLTLEEVLIGYGIGSCAGAAMAVLLTWSDAFYDIVEPYFLAVYAVPSIALAPLIIVWFGLGITSKIVLAGYYVFFVVFLNVASGVRSIRESWLDTARIMGATPFQLIRLVVIPGAWPHVMTGLRTGLPQAVVGAIVGEFLSSQHGIGFLVVDASARYNTAGVFAAIAILSLFIVIINAALNVRSSQGQRT